MAHPVKARSRLLSALMFGALVTAGACGGESTSSADLPSLGGSGAGSEDGSSSTSTTANPEKAAQAFVACLREQGLEVADPEVGADGQIDFRTIFDSANLGPGSEEGRTAMDACRDELDGAGFGPSEDDRAARQEAMLSFTSCLRGEGLTVEDPSFEGPGGMRPGAPPEGAVAGGSGASGDTASNGSVGTSGPIGAASGVVGSAGVGQGPQVAPGQPPSEEERTQRLAEMLDLDPADEQVSAAFDACSDKLADLGGPGGPGGQAASTTTTSG